ncbi:MAG: type II secretion system F family protein [Gemmatimonadetes bacterium]|nr:type II secretion system F family protein [Gemmatimonadota bacterium]
MVYVIAVLIMTAVTMAVFVVAVAVPERPRTIRRRLATIDDQRDRMTPRRQRRNRQKREQLEALAQALGDRVASHRSDVSETRLSLLRAGFRSPNAVPVYYTLRILLAAGFAFGATVLATVAGAPAYGSVFGMLVFAAFGWLLPRSIMSRRKRKRSFEIQIALPDMLDMMVVCVEAGLGLNQAMDRVASELTQLSRILSDELRIVNIEMETGTPREDALRNLAERSDNEDLRSLVAMLIQTDRFGTSIARALRVHSKSLRTKRRQRAEEAAAKTTIKLVFPLVFFVFPAMFVVILAPAVLHIIRQMGGLT